MAGVILKPTCPIVPGEGIFGNRAFLIQAQEIYLKIRCLQTSQTLILAIAQILPALIQVTLKSWIQTGQLVTSEQIISLR